MVISTNYRNETEIENTLKELSIYLIFLMVTTIVCFSSNDQYMFHYNQMIKRLFLTRTSATINGVEMNFFDVVTVEDWWHFMKTTFLNGLHGEVVLAENEPTGTGDLPEDTVSDEQPSIISPPPNDHADKYIQNSILLGQPRIRQLRVASDTCLIHKVFQQYFRRCYARFNLQYEETENPMIESKYVESSIIDSIFTWGKLAYYPGGGFIEFLNDTRLQNEEIIHSLMDKKWIDRGTRFLAVEFSLYNVNVNLFCIVKFFAEISPTGGFIPWASVQSFKFLTLWTLFDYFYVSCLFIFYVMIVYYTIEEIRDCGVYKAKYLLSIWNCLDLTVILIGYISLFYIIIRILYLKTIFERYEHTKNRYLNLDQIAYLEFLYNNLMGILIFLVWIKIFKYISFNKTMTQFSTTLNRCSKDLIGFGVMFLIVFIAFAQLGYLLFGTENASFQTFRISMLTMLRMILGDFDYPAIEEANRILGPIYFLTYIFIVFFILLNMFLAIINDTYSDVKSEQTHNPFLLGEYLKKRYRKCCDLLCCRPESKEYDKDILPEDTIEIPERNKSEEFSIRKSQMIPKLFEVVDDDKKASSNEIKKLNDRINHIEATLNRVLHGIDAMVNKLETERIFKKNKY